MAALGCALLLGAGLASAQEKPANPSEVYGARIQATTLAATTTPYSATRDSLSSADTLRYWNQIAIDASGLDHTAVQPGENRVFGEQLGPGRSARAVAIVQIAVYDATNAIVGGYQRYTKTTPASKPASVDAAIIAAAHDTLVAMWPSQKPYFDQLQDEDLNRIIVKSAAQKQAGVAVGKEAAKLILAMRANDHSAGADPKMDGEWSTSDQPGHWRQDPIGKSPIAMGAHWGEVTPFVLISSKQFRIPAPPKMNSAAYTAAYNEVKSLGGDGVHTPTQRTEEQAFIGVFWAYDGTPSLCAPPRLYNQVTAEISKKETSVIKLARLFALVNVSMADAGIASWESKYYWDFWRPVGGIRESDPGTGPTGLGDGNPATLGDPHFWPLGAPASNLQGPNFTPPFPSYPSGHATFGGALFETLRNFYGTDKIAFTFVSDEFNGETRANDGTVRPYRPRSFDNLSQAEEENGQSRIYLGIHWAFDKTEGIKQGRKVADYVFAHEFRPL
ncbi:MAG TPA: hypothetical protein VMF52_20440 [Steroidobacteraceae bacterium]|nr:hypothetical protein [Steroidobacteraceae bacterium]